MQAFKLRKQLVHLTDEQRDEARQRLAAGETGAKIAADMDVCESTISRLRDGKRERRRAEIASKVWVKRIRILPDNNNDIPMQVCERLHCRLTVAACASRWQASKGAEERYPSCKGCPIGQRNQRRAEIAYAASRVSKSAIVRTE
jgi:IS30 family transposase